MCAIRNIFCWCVVGSAIRCYVCNSAEDFEGERCDYVPEDGKGYEDLVYDCDSLPEELGRSEVRNYTLCRKFVQDGKLTS